MWIIKEILRYLILTVYFLSVTSEESRGFSGLVFHTREQATSFLVNVYNRPSRSKRSVIPELCHTDEFYCEEHMPQCFSEDVRESFCSVVSCQPEYACFMSVPCPVHYEYECTKDLCRADPCQNGGTCLNGYNNGFACKCVEGTGGDTCQTDTVNECDSRPCLHGATCTDAISKAICTCALGYEGDTCEIDIDECALYTSCLNGGTCVDQVNGYTCYYIDECALYTPCLNGGTCVDQVNGYTCYCEEDYTGVDCETDMCSPVESHGIDVIFVMDMSESEAPRFEKQKNYILDFISEFPIGANETRIGVVSFSNYAAVQFHLNEHDDNASLAVAVNNLQYLGGASNIGKAFRVVREEMLMTDKGARATAVKYVIVLTDGLFTDLVDARTGAEMLRVDGVTLYAVCFGHSILHEELIYITGHPSRVFSPNNKDGVNSLLKLNVMEECPDCYRTTSDVAIAMEMSSFITKTEYYTRLDAIKSFLSATFVSPTGIRVSYVIYGETVNEVFPFDAYTNKEGVISAILQTRPGFAGASNLSQILDYFLHDGFSTTKGSRSDHRKLLIITTNGPTIGNDAVYEKAVTLLESNVTIVVIATGRDVNLTSLNTITSDSSYVFTIGEEFHIDKSILRILDGLMTYDVCNFN